MDYHVASPSEWSGTSAVSNRRRVYHVHVTWEREFFLTPVIVHLGCKETNSIRHIEVFGQFRCEH